MVRFFFFIISGLLLSETVWAAAADYDRYFKVDMKMEVPDINTYIKKLDTMDQFYDKGYESRFKMGRKFKSVFNCRFVHSISRIRL